eukprot:15438127-Alexandrium_andersonii.AAC.2
MHGLRHTHANLLGDGPFKARGQPLATASVVRNKAQDGHALLGVCRNCRAVGRSLPEFENSDMASNIWSWQGKDGQAMDQSWTERF